MNDEKRDLLELIALKEKLKEISTRKEELEGRLSDLVIMKNEDGT